MGSNMYATWWWNHWSLMSYATCSWFFFPVTVAESAFKELFLWAPSSKHASQVFTVACDRTRAFRRPPGIRGIQEPKKKQDFYHGYFDVNYRGTSGFDPSHGKLNHGVSVQVLAPPPAAAPPAAPVGAVVEAPRRHRKSQIVIAMHTLW